MSCLSRRWLPALTLLLICGLITSGCGVKVYRWRVHNETSQPISYFVAFQPCGVFPESMLPEKVVQSGATSDAFMAVYGAKENCLLFSNAKESMFGGINSY